MMNDEGEEIMLSEVEKAIKDLKEKKAPGKDDITAEMIKSSGPLYYTHRTQTSK